MGTSGRASRDRLTSRKEFLRVAAAGATLATCPGLAVACGPTLSEKLSVEPQRVRSDEPFVVRLADLPPGERVILSAKFDDRTGKQWSSTTVFEANEDGRVDTSEQAPVKGSYDTQDTAGLVWSAQGRDFYVPPTDSSPIEITAEVGEERTSKKVERYTMAEGVESSDLRRNGLVGRLFLPAKDSRPAPGVLVLSGSEGGLSPSVSREAALLASHGFAALALAYFKGEDFVPENAGDLPEKLVKVPLEYFGRAIGWLETHEAVRGDRLGVVGHSRGGELALLLGANYQKLQAVVSYVGSGIVVNSPGAEEPTWTFGGEPLPRISFFAEPSEITREQEKQAEIPVERTNGPILLIAAGEDRLWPSVRFSEVAMDRLKRHDHAHDDELVVYPGAGHTIQAPYVPAVPTLGGKTKANAEANEDSWRKTLGLLERRLKQG